MPAKLSAGRDSLSQMKLWLPAFFGALLRSVPAWPRNQVRGLVRGTGKRLKSEM